MKKIVGLVILFFMILLIVDSSSYLKNHKEMIKLNEIYQKEGKEIEFQHMNVFEKQSEYFRDGKCVLIQFLFPILVIIIGCFSFHENLHSGFFKNIVSRVNFKQYIKKSIFNSWKAAFIIPVFFIISFVFSCLVTNFNFSGRQIGLETILFMIVNLMIVSVSCINIGLIFSRKNKNFIIMAIFSYLFIIVYQIAMEIIIGPILASILNSLFFANGLTLFSFWYYDSGVTIINMFIYAMVLFCITGFFLKLTYKNMEEVVIDAEK